MTTTVPTDFAPSPAMRRLTNQLHQHMASWHQADAQARVAVGQMLRQAKAQMDHGQWLRWLETEMPFRPRSAQLYMELAAWAADNPELFARLAPLGPSKLYVMFKMSAPQLSRLTRRRYHTVPSSGLSLQLSQLSFQQFIEVLKALDNDDEANEPTFSEKLMATSEKQVKALRKTILHLIAYREAMPEDDVVDLYETLEEALAWLAKAYAIDEHALN